MRMFLNCFVFPVVAALCMAEPAFGQPGTNAQPVKPSVPTLKPGPARKVDVEEFDKLRQDKANMVLDVRTKKEFEAGHIPNAVNLDFNAPGFAQRVSALDTNKVYLVHCAAGVRSARACAEMDRLGFRHLYDLAPGFKAWEKAGKPVEK
jgi:rhodanese-related sulfurtransferase